VLAAVRDLDRGAVVAAELWSCAPLASQSRQA